LFQLNDKKWRPEAVVESAGFDNVTNFYCGCSTSRYFLN